MSVKGKPAYFDKDGRRYCTGCQEMKHKDHFGGEGKYAISVCKQCKAEKAQAARQLKIGAKMTEAIDVLKEHVGRGAKIPHTAELVEELMLACGGPKVLMEAFWRSMAEAEDGTLTKLKHFDTAIKLVKDNAALGGAKKPMDTMDIDELREFIRVRIGPEAGLLEHDVTDEDFDAGLRPVDEDDDGMAAGSLAS